MTSLLEKRQNGHSLKPFSLFLDDLFYEPVKERADYHVKENDNGITYKFLLPEYDKKDVKITVENNHLVILAENDNNVFSSKNTYKIRLYKDFDVDKTKVKLENGVLTIDLAYSEKQKPRQIEIK